MRRMAMSLFIVLTATALSPAQGVPTAADVEPPLEIVVPDPTEELPPPAAQPDVVLPRAAHNAQLRPGMFVTSAELYPRVKIDDAHNIHPQAVPMIVAVMDPRSARRTRFAQTSGTSLGLVFVKVFAPPYPPKSVKVKHDKVELDWGEYEIKIESEDGVVEIEYED